MSTASPSIRPLGFHHIAIKVHDYDRAVAFYTALGFKPTLDWGEGASRGILLDAGDGNYFEIFAGGPANIVHPKMGENAPLIHIAFRVADIQAMTDAAVAAGATLLQAPKAITMGRPAGGPGNGKQVPITVSFVQAPTGETVEFFYNPPGLL